MTLILTSSKSVWTSVVLKMVRKGLFEMVFKVGIIGLAGVIHGMCGNERGHKQVQSWRLRNWKNGDVHLIKWGELWKEAVLGIV